jgi:hypothetical protein
MADNSVMNALIRSKAGLQPEAQQPEPPAPVGPGSADGAAGTNSTPRLSSGDLMNKIIRSEAGR